MLVRGGGMGKNSLISRLLYTRLLYVLPPLSSQLSYVIDEEMKFRSAKKLASNHRAIEIYVSILSPRHLRISVPCFR